MVRKDTPYILPVGGSGVLAVKIVAVAYELRVEYTFGAGYEEHAASLEFQNVIAYRFRNEMHSAGFSSDSYDALVEIPESPWRRELLKNEPKQIWDTNRYANRYEQIWDSARDMTHFAVFFSSNGYLEVMANSFTAIDPREE